MKWWAVCGYIISFLMVSVVGFVTAMAIPFAIVFFIKTLIWG